MKGSCYSGGVWWVDFIETSHRKEGHGEELVRSRIGKWTRASLDHSKYQNFIHMFRPRVSYTYTSICPFGRKLCRQQNVLRGVYILTIPDPLQEGRDSVKIPIAQAS